MTDAEIGEFIDVGRRLAEVRASRKQQDIADLWGVSKKTYGLYERGARLPSPKLLVALHVHLGVDLNWLFTGVRQKPEKQAVLDNDALTDAIETALMTADAVRERGKSHTPAQVAAYAKTLYEIAIAEKVDRIISPAEHAIIESLEAANDARDENGDHEVHRRSRAGKR